MSIEVSFDLFKKMAGSSLTNDGRYTCVDKHTQLRKLAQEMYSYVVNREIELCNACTEADDGDCNACDEYDGACGIAKRRFEEFFSGRMRELGIGDSND